MERDDFNPYAPPKADPNVRPAASFIPPLAGPNASQIQAALARLKMHVASPSNVDNDLRVAGSRIRTVTTVFCALFGLSLLGLVGTISQDLGGRNGIPIAASIAAVFFILALIFVLVDLPFVPRTQAVPPEKALKRFLRALALGRGGYALAMLSPTAREQSVTAPDLGPIPTGSGSFAMASPEGLKEYGKAFARPDKRNVRGVRVKSAVAHFAPGNPDVAVVTAELAFQSFPVWVNILIGVGAAVFRPAIIVGAILLVVMRKKHNLTVTKTFLQGQPGVWYLFDASVLEAPPQL